MEPQTILVVDDDLDVREILHDILKTKGYRPLTVSTGEAALASLTQQPGVALIDVKLKESSGLDVMRKIKERAPNIECIVLTGHASQTSAIQAVNLGAYSYIVKPYEMDQLLLTIRRAMEKHTTKKTIVEQEHYFRSLLHNIHEDILVIDPNYRIVDVNRPILLTTGHHREDIIGRRCFEALHHYNMPCDDDNNPCYLQTVFETGKPQNFHHRHPQDDEEEIWIDILLSPLRNEAGEVTHVLEAMRDLTDLMEAQEELRESERRYRLLAETAQDMIIIHDLEGQISYVNQAVVRALGLAKEEILGTTITQFIPTSELATLHQRRAQRAGGDRERLRYETEFVSREGRRTPVEVVSSPMLQDHEIQNVLIVARDISERKEAEAELQRHRERLEEIIAERTGELEARVSEVERLNKAMTNLLEDLQASNRRLERTSARLKAVNEELNDFAYVVSHDLKAPLRGITQLSNWLITDHAGDLNEDGLRMLNLLMGRAKRMHDLIEGILRYSRVGRVQERRKEIDLNALVADILDLLAPPDHIEVTVASELPTVWGEETRFRQVFQNLLSNAIKFLDKPRGRIALQSTDQGDVWRFSVTDNGPGIAAKYYDKVFQMFQTLAPRDEYESTGVGLPLVKKIVESWGGQIWLESTVGEGSTFYFTVPKSGEA